MDIKTKQDIFELTITADKVISTDSRFTQNNLGLGDSYETIATYFLDANGNKTVRERRLRERLISNRTMPALACQIYEKQLDALTADEKRNFPICQYKPSEATIRGISTSVEEYIKSHRNHMVYFTYDYDDGKQFVFEYWNLFSTIAFVQECLERFGSYGDKFILEYKEKENKLKKLLSNEEAVTHEEAVAQEPVRSFQGYKNKYSNSLIESKNIIFRGAPGTGKTYLAKKIAADIVSDGATVKYDDLTTEQKQQIEFVQFHPSYDYTDFVEGLRPKINDDGSMGFKLRDGIFKAFVDRARKNYENSQKSLEIIEKEMSVQEAMDEFFSNIDFTNNSFATARNRFTITEIDDEHVRIYISSNPSSNSVLLELDKIKKMLEAEIDFELNDIKDFFGYARRMQEHSYYLAIYNEIKELKSKKKKLIAQVQVKKEELKKYVFIIDEINRGEISKIFGELFFTIDPGYRGSDGAVKTQYANLHSNQDEKFYIPDNVYIIGTMNDIDRSVDSFDFAMRRRFRFIELKADEHIEMLDELGDTLKREAINRMSALNKAILEVEDLNENYQIGASYFMKLKTLSFDQLWTDYLKPLLQEYIRGVYDEPGIMSKFEKAYGFNKSNDGDANDDSHQG